MRALLTVICGCTYIMTVSSAYRMLLYISSYHLTFLRLLVLWGLVMIAVVMTGVLVYTYNQKFSLFRFVLMTLTVGWLCFSAAHPDYWIASYNIAACEEGQEYDSSYLRRSLSLDAVAALPEEVWQERNSSYNRRLERYQRQQENLWDSGHLTFQGRMRPVWNKSGQSFQIRLVFVKAGIKADRVFGSRIGRCGCKRCRLL